MCHFYFYDSFGKYGLLILDKNYCTVIFSNELHINLSPIIVPCFYVQFKRRFLHFTYLAIQRAQQLSE